MSEYTKAVRFYSRVFEPSLGSSPGGTPSKSRWLIMQIDTAIDPYDWVAISRDFRFSQSPYVNERSEENLLNEIQSYVDKTQVAYGRNLFLDRNNQPWAIAANGAYQAAALTGAYDGYYYLATAAKSGENLVQLIEQKIANLVATKALGSIDPPSSLEGFTKQDGLNQVSDPYLQSKEGTGTGSGTGLTTGPGSVTSPWQLPQAESQTGPMEKRQEFPTGALLAAGAAVAAIYYFSKSKA